MVTDTSITPYDFVRGFLDFLDDMNAGQRERIRFALNVVLTEHDGCSIPDLWGDRERILAAFEEADVESSGQGASDEEAAILTKALATLNLAILGHPDQDTRVSALRLRIFLDGFTANDEYDEALFRLSEDLDRMAKLVPAI